MTCSLTETQRWLRINSVSNAEASTRNHCTSKCEHCLDYHLWLVGFVPPGRLLKISRASQAEMPWWCWERARGPSSFSLPLFFSSRVVVTSWTFFSVSINVLYSWWFCSRDLVLLSCFGILTVHGFLHVPWERTSWFLTGFLNLSVAPYLSVTFGVFFFCDVGDPIWSFSHPSQVLYYWAASLDPVL